MIKERIRQFNCHGYQKAGEGHQLPEACLCPRALSSCPCLCRRACPRQHLQRQRRQRQPQALNSGFWGAACHAGYVQRQHACVPWQSIPCWKRRHGDRLEPDDRQQQRPGHPPTGRQLKTAAGIWPVSLWIAARFSPQPCRKTHDHHCDPDCCRPSRHALMRASRPTQASNEMMAARGRERGATCCLDNSLSFAGCSWAGCASERRLASCFACQKKHE